MSVKVFVLASVDPGEAAAFEAAYRQVAARMKDVSGLVRDELLRDASGDGRYVLVGEWEDEVSFRKWFDGPEHLATTTPMRPFWNGRSELRVLNVASSETC